MARLNSPDLVEQESHRATWSLSLQIQRHMNLFAGNGYNFRQSVAVGRRPRQQQVVGLPRCLLILCCLLLIADYISCTSQPHRYTWSGRNTKSTKLKCWALYSQSTWPKCQQQQQLVSFVVVVVVVLPLSIFHFVYAASNRLGSLITWKIVWCLIQ